MISKVDFQKTLFPGRDLEKEWKSRYGTYELPPLVELTSKRVDAHALLDEYNTYKGREHSIFEDEVIGYAFGLRYCTPEEYWPMVVHLPSDEAIRAQKEVDEERNIPWADHQRTLSVRQRLRSVIKLNEDYDPLIDERNYTKMPKKLRGGYIEAVLNMFRANTVRARFVRLRPGETLADHIDYNPKYCLKAHIPMTSQSLSYMKFFHKNLGEITYRMKPGRIYVINSGIRHEAINESLVHERIHLVISLDGQQDIFSYVGTNGFAYELPRKRQAWE